MNNPAMSAPDLPPISELLRLGTELHKTGLLPAHVRSGGQAMAIILAGRELGLAPMTALRSIHLVEGRVTLAADLQLALVKRAGVKHRWLRTDAEAATVELTRGADQPFAFTYSIEDAKRAGLAGKQNWQRHTPAMLRARAISAAIRAYCPDVLTSVYDPDELRSGEVYTDAEATPARPDSVIELVPRALVEAHRAAALPGPVAAPGAPGSADDALALAERWGLEITPDTRARLEAPDHASWASEREAFTARLTELGLENLHEAIKLFICAQRRKPKPSALAPEHRAMLLDQLAEGQDYRSAFETWRREIASSLPDDGEE